MLGPAVSCIKSAFTQCVGTELDRSFQWKWPLCSWTLRILLNVFFFFIEFQRKIGVIFAC